VSGNKESPNAHMDPDVVLQVLEIILDPQAHPVLVHCNQGNHRVGCVMGLLRKLQRWSLTAIFDEYRRFAANKARIADLEYVELTDVSGLQVLVERPLDSPCAQ
jgi:tyrosine-protein phosphatase SIW14